LSEGIGVDDSGDLAAVVEVVLDQLPDTRAGWNVSASQLRYPVRENSTSRSSAVIDGGGTVTLAS
jgi:hypothetical protein